VLYVCEISCGLVSRGWEGRGAVRRNFERRSAEGCVVVSIPRRVGSVVVYCDVFVKWRDGYEMRGRRFGDE